MEQSISTKGLVNWLLLLVLTVAVAALGHYAGSVTGYATAAFIGMGFLVALVAYIQMRLEEREQLEQMEVDELRKSASSSSLFTGADAELFPARRAREQFERFIVPGFAILLLLGQAAGVNFLWRLIVHDWPATTEQATVAMTLNGLLALVYFQVGKYSAVLARLQNQRLLRPQASYVLLGSVLCVVAAGVEAAGWAGYPGVDRTVARILVMVLGLVAAENLITLVLEIYRPRVKGQAAHPLYESRLIGILSQPGGLITTAAQALDYQFGFKVSQTWFYRFLERAFAWLVLVQLTILLLSTSFVFVEPGEQAVLQRFGRPVAGREILGPGPHVKWPWPVDRVQRYQTERVQSFTVGIVEEEEHVQQRVVLWSKPHAKEEFNLLVASREAQTGAAPTEGEQAVPVNMLSVKLPVQYQIHDLVAYAYGHADAGRLLQAIAQAEVTRYLVNVDFDEIMGRGRRAASEVLLQRIQARADAYKLGVKVLFVGLHGIHPPVKIAPEFERVFGAMQERAATNHYARAYAAERLPLAQAEAARKVNEAEAARSRLTALAAGTAARFTNQVLAYQASPEVYRLRTYLDTVSRATAPARKYVIVPSNTHEVVTFNLEDRIRQDLLDVALPAASK
jgi:regulator of protease activity HflC (stomatin/prohibitin superfamily)